ncbi:MAG: bifunctional oligoribonuclease/PAP phosphatase NrnA [candidate division Zixibacteria bacterium]|nr:bifunctional oligoribonuclease/PAP phosphatase NrnA [candidate division Zixibacteria bacterium]
MTNVNPEALISEAVAKIDEIHDRIASASTVLVVSHIDPDGDALGTQLACGHYLTEIGKTVVMTHDSNIPVKYHFLPEIEKIVRADTLDKTQRFDVALVLECPVIDRAGNSAHYLAQSDTIINIDHHRDNNHYGHINWLDVSASSVGQMMFEYFAQTGYRIPQSVAEHLYTAVLTDSGRFRYGTTSARTFEVAAELVRCGANPRHICDQIYYNTPQSWTKLLAVVLQSLEFHAQGKACFLSLTKEMLKKNGAQESESDGLVDYTLYSQGVEAGALFKEVDKSHTKVSLRTKDHVNASIIAAIYGGGGHFNAAGCLLPKSIEEAKLEILTHLQEQFSPHE